MPHTGDRIGTSDLHLPLHVSFCLRVHVSSHADSRMRRRDMPHDGIAEIQHDR